MNRREFLHYASMLSVAGMVPELAWATGRPDRHQRIVVLVELKGGNDGFNTLVPFADPLYSEYRPTLAIKERQLVKLDDRMGMHPHFKVLAPLWERGQMAWIQGVGYQNGILSHFRSMDIWDTASNANQVLNKGWLSQVLPKYKKGLHGIALNRGQAQLGPLNSSDLNSVTMQNPRTFLSQTQLIEDVQPSGITPALAKVTRTQHQLFDVGKQIKEKMGKQPVRLPVQFSKGVFGHSLESVAQMILSGIDAPVYKVTQDGFDTHSKQRGAQDNSLYQVTNGLASFAKAMQKGGMWDNVLVVTYSEFGRRAKENRGGGTDHGTASSHFVLGGKVHGGIYGKHPDFSRLDGDGNVQHTVDFRSIYATLAQRWWHQPSPWKLTQLPFV